jgi:hypothetical protein
VPDEFVPVYVRDAPPPPQPPAPAVNRPPTPTPTPTTNPIPFEAPDQIRAQVPRPPRFPVRFRAAGLRKVGGKADHRITRRPCHP